MTKEQRECQRDQRADWAWRRLNQAANHVQNAKAALWDLTLGGKAPGLPPQDKTALDGAMDVLNACMNEMREMAYRWERYQRQLKG